VVPAGTSILPTPLRRISPWAVTIGGAIRYSIDVIRYLESAEDLYATHERAHIDAGLQMTLPGFEPPSGAAG
jgi:hypothetical protein